MEGTSKEGSSMCNYAPVVHIKDEHTGEEKTYKMMVYIGHKTMIALFFEE